MSSAELSQCWRKKKKKKKKEVAIFFDIQKAYDNLEKLNFKGGRRRGGEDKNRDK